MSNALAWVLILELTIGLAVGGYLLYHIHTALTMIILQHCSIEPDLAVDEPPVLTAEVVEEAPTHQHDDATDTTGTFTGAAWK